MARIGVIAQQAVDFGLAVDINAARRLFQQQEVRLAIQRLRDGDLLLVAARQRPDALRCCAGLYHEAFDSFGCQVLHLAGFKRHDIACNFRRSEAGECASTPAEVAAGENQETPPAPAVVVPAPMITGFTPASQLAGLHLHFFLQTLLLAKSGDVGAFVTSAEWLDVNYGSALRRLFLGPLGGVALHVLDPKVEAFPGTASTAAISCFRIGEMAQPVRVRAVENAARLNGLRRGVEVSRDQLKAAPRWSIIVRPSAADVGGTIELGELCRVHRGQVTGANDIWIENEQAVSLPDRVKLPTVTKARDLIDAGDQLRRTDMLRRVIDLPPDLAEFNRSEQRNIEAFLRWAEARGADKGYIARHRKAWWSVGLRAPAPILCTNMARRPPQFTLNTCGAHHINIAHGLYPRDDLAPAVLAKLVAWLNKNVNTGSGRTYAGGLTKFEPKEIERLRIPSLDKFLA